MHTATWQTLIDRLVLADRFGARPIPVRVAQHRDDLLSGRVVTEQSSEGGVIQVGAACLVQGSADAVWASVRDDDVVSDGSIDEHLLESSAAGDLWYGRMRLPGPLADRQWVVRCQDNAELYARSQGHIREWSWRELTDGPDLAVHHLGRRAIKGARWLPIQRGAWLVAGIDEDTTLLGYHSRIASNSRVPGWMLRELSAGRIPPLLRKVARHSVAA